MRKWKWFAVAAGSIAILLCWRLSLTSEYIACCGSEKQKIDLCRSVPDLSAGRRSRILSWLLHDSSEAVRSSAITAYGKSPAVDEFEAELERIMSSTQAPAILRSKAGEILLSRKTVRKSIIGFLQENVKERVFRENCPILVALFAKHQLPALSVDARRRLLLESFDESDPAHEHLQKVLREKLGYFKEFRDEFLQQLRKEIPFRTRQFAVAGLTEIEGIMRGHSAADWLEPTARSVESSRLSIFEAEWVTEIQPNYQIGTFEGERCLLLGEGAGGYMGWLKGHDGTVDIASARCSLFVPRDGLYSVWARVYMDDKCGNSFGFWMNNRNYSNFPDKSNVLKRWNWLRLKHGKQEFTPLKSGFAPVRLEAWEDGVYIDKFALLPKDTPAEKLSSASAVRWDPKTVPSISFAMEEQAQSRGTIRKVILWVRRHIPEIRQGRITLMVPEPFLIKGRATVDLRFADGDPLARTSFYLHLPRESIGGEAVLKARYLDEKGTAIEGEIILGAQFDWLTTGPLPPSSALHRKLSNVAETGRSKYIRSDWKRYPVKGYGRYRRLLPEKAFGQLQGKYIYLCTDIRIDKAGEYLGLLTADDSARVYLDDKLIIAQHSNGPGEGRLVQRRFHATAGRHRLFVRLYQAGFSDPVGPDAGRHSANHCNFKLLLRRKRHEPAPEIRGLPSPIRK